MSDPNVSSALALKARERPDADALILPDGRRVSYRALDADASAIARGLASLGVTPGTRVALLVPPGFDFFPLVFGLLRAAAVPVVVDPGMGLARMRGCLEDAAPGAFIGVAKAHVARVFRGLGGPTVRLKVGVGPCFGLGGIPLDEVRRRGSAGASGFPAVGADDMAAILFTSGSTGTPKGAVYTHGNFAAQVEMVRRTFGIEAGEIDLPTFPLFALFDPALGMTTVVPDMDFARPAAADPRKIVDAIRLHAVTTMFASPGLLGPLSSHCERERAALPSLRRVITAGAPVDPRIVERMAKVLPGGALLHTPYGATEALPVATIDHRTILGETRAKSAAGAGICVGRPVEGVEVRCIRVDDGPIRAWAPGLEVPRGTPGEVCVRGPQVTRAYVARPEADALGKIPDAAGGPWHRMGDVGYLDESGRLWFCGRKSQRIRTDAGDLYADQCEAVFLGDHLVERAAVVGVRADGRQKTVLCVQIPGLGHEFSNEELAARLVGGAASQAIRRMDYVVRYPGALPVDTRHNAKIQREELAKWAAKRLRA